MNCHICNSEMAWGNIYLKGKLDWLYGYEKHHIFFDSYNQNTKPEKIIEKGQFTKGLFCNNCGAVCISKNDIPDVCPNCGTNIITGSYQIRKSSIGRYLRNSLNHLYFTSEKMQKSIMVLQGGFFVRGFYCHGCGTLYFESNNNKPLY